MTSQTSSAPLSDHVIKKYQESGIEIKKVFLKRKVVGLSVKNPLETLLNKDFITKEEFRAAEKYVEDYTMANMARHAKPNWGDIPKATNDDEKGDLWDRQCKAEEAVNHIRFLLQSADTKYQLAPAAKGSKPHTAKKYLKILKCVFEEQKSIYHSINYLHMKNSVIEQRIKEILKIIFNYYEL